MTRYLLKEPVEVLGDGEWVKLGTVPDSVFLHSKYLEVINDREAADLSKKSAHAIGLMIESRDTIIKGLRKDLADARAGGQPASQLRDAVLPVLHRIDEFLGLEPDARRLMTQLIAHLKTIPTLEPPTDKVADKVGIKPYKPLDHGPRDNEAAAEQYRKPPQ